MDSSVPVCVQASGRKSTVNAFTQLMLLPVLAGRRLIAVSQNYSYDSGKVCPHPPAQEDGDYKTKSQLMGRMLGYSCVVLFCFFFFNYV